MRKPFHGSPPAVAAAVLTGALLGVALSAGAADRGFLADSLATLFVQGRAMVQILRADDPLDRRCSDRRFTDAWVVPDSRKLLRTSAFPERKWQEQWTLLRCGTSVGYRVFFTEVGDGGVYFSVRKNRHMQRPATLQRAPRLADSDLLPAGAGVEPSRRRARVR